MSALLSAATKKPHTAVIVPKPRRLKIGDVVELRSGSGRMCVIAIYRSGAIRCARYDSNEKIQRATFPEAALEFQPKQVWDDNLRTFVAVVEADV